MENLNLNDPPPQGALPPQRGLPPPPQTPQLPPQMFTTAAQLLDLTDKKLLVCLRDGRKLIGVLRSWDQFANLVLQNTVERLFATDPSSTPDRPAGVYADVPHGIFLVRGENVLLLGEIDLDKDDDPPPGFVQAEVEVVKRLVEEKKTAEKAHDKTRQKRLGELGFEGENLAEVLF